MAEQRNRKLEVEELPLAIQNEIIQMNTLGVPVIQIVDALKTKHDIEITDVSLSRFTTKYIEPKVTDKAKNELSTSFDRAIKNMNNLHGLNEEAIRRLQAEPTDEKWYANLRNVGLNTLNCFNALYLIQGQKISSEEKTSDLGDQMDKINQMIKRARKERVDEDPITV